MADEQPGIPWHGWTLEQADLYIAPIGPADPRIALWTRYDGGAPQVAAVFVNDLAGQEVMAWVDGSLQSQAQLNEALARQLGFA